jgi:YbbR domain-containing protein
MNLLRRLLLRNLGLKLTSIFLAVLLWSQIEGQQRVVRTVPVLLEFVNMPTGLEIVNDYRKEVNVRLSRPLSARMDERQLAAVIDLRDCQPGQNILPVTEGSIRNLSSGVEIEGIEQNRIRLDLERTRRKTVKIEPIIVGQPAEGFELGGTRVNPSEVLVSGPEARLELVTEADTQPIDIGGKTESFSQNVYLDLEDPRLRFESADSVDVLVFIEEERRDMTMKLPVQVLPKAARVRVSPSSIEVTISVPISFDGEIDSKDFYAVITIEEGVDTTPGQKLDVAASVVTPEGVRDFVRVELVDPAQVTLTFR